MIRSVYFCTQKQDPSRPPHRGRGPPKNSKTLTLKNIKIMKKFIAIAALAAAMFVGNVTEVNAQSTLDGKDYKAVNHAIHEVHVNDYMNKGDDEYRLGHYEAAMEAYKSARRHNNIDETIVPNSVIDRKMDRCADAMRKEKSRSYNNGRDNGRTWRDTPARGKSVLDLIFGL